MIQKIRTSIKNIDLQLFLALLFLGVCPTLYTTLRVFFLGNLPGDRAFSIAGQLSWVSLIYEVFSEALILPLFYFIGKVKSEKQAFSGFVRSGMIFCFLIYAGLSAIILFFAEPMLALMAADKSIIAASAVYIRIESIANVFLILAQFALVALVSLSKSRYLYILTVARLLLSVICDTFLISPLPFSLNCGVNGIAYSNIIVNILLLAVSLFLLKREGVGIFGKFKSDLRRMKEFFKVGGISGTESLIRNLAYIVMISRMVNVVGEQGTYWVANNFIWQWLLLPVLQLGELIKEEVAENRENVMKNTCGYFGITLVICALWFISIPLWKPFMAAVLKFSDVDKLYRLVMLLVGFYVLFAFQNIFDATFYGLGKTGYMLFESVVTNSVFYGIAFILYLKGIWIPTLTGIAFLFGFGTAFDSIVSYAAYIYMRKKEKLC